MTRNAVRAIVKTSVEAEDIKRKRENAYLKSIGFNSWDERKRELLNAYTAGTSINELTNIFKIGKKKIHRIAKDEPNGEEITRQRKISQQNIRLEKITHRNLFIARAYGFGIDIHKIAARVKLDKDNVYKIASNSEIAVQNRKQAKLRNNHLTETQKRYQVIYRAYGLGIDAKTIADKFGFSKNTIHKIIQSSPNSQEIYQNRAEAKQRVSLNPIRKLTPEERRLGAIYHTYSCGVKTKKILERFGISNYTALYKIIENSGKQEELTTKRDKAKQDKIERVRAQYVSGLPVSEIAENNDIIQDSVFDYINSFENPDILKQQRKQNKTEVLHQQMYQDYTDNMPIAEMAVKYKYNTPGAVTAFIKRSNLYKKLYQMRELTQRDQEFDNDKTRYVISRFIQNDDRGFTVKDLNINTTTAYNHLVCLGRTIKSCIKLEEEIESAEDRKRFFHIVGKSAGLFNAKAEHADGFYHLVQKAHEQDHLEDIYEGIQETAEYLANKEELVFVNHPAVTDVFYNTLDEIINRHGPPSDLTNPAWEMLQERSLQYDFAE